MFRIFMMRLTILFVVFTLTACGNPNSMSTALPTQTLTFTFTPTRTPSPEPSSTPTLTPFPTLSGEKPYLMVRQNRDDQVFSIYDTNGGRKIIELPPDGYTKGLNQKLDTIVSPDGKWLIFYSGSMHYLDSKSEIPVTLKLLSISDGTIRKVADVVTDGYENKLDQLAENLKQLYPDHYKNIDDPNQSGGIDWVGDGLLKAFEWGIYSVAWSPDSHTLAFAAQIDGLSSDVYLYDVEKDTVQQAEDSLQNVTGIRWSPDGKKIIFNNSGPGYGYMGVPELYVIPLGEKVIKNPTLLSSQAWIGSFDQFTQTWSPTGDWLSPNLLLVTGQTPDAGSSGIDAIHIDTNEMTRLWGDIFGNYAIDSKNKIVIISPSDYTDPENLGVYFVTLSGQKTKIFDGLYYLDLFFRGGEKHRFLLQGISIDEIQGNKIDAQYPVAGEVIGLDVNGEPTSLGKFDHKQQISVSPDYAWVLIYDDENLRLYDKNDSLVKTFLIPGIQRAIWQPDSQAIFYSTTSELLRLSLPIGETKWVDTTELYDAVWLP